MATRVRLVGVNQAIAGIRKEVDNKRKAGIAIVKKAALAGVEAMMRNTPVWEGVTVANYGVGVGRRGRRSALTPPGGVHQGARWPRAQEIKLLGATNQQALGTEKRRGPSEALARQQIRATLNGMRDKLENVIIFNSAPNWDEIDTAQWPGGVNQKIRNQATVSRLGEQEMVDIIKGAK